MKTEENILMASDMNDYFNKKKNEGGPKKSSGGSGGGPTGPKMPNIDFNMGGKSGIVYFIIAVVIMMVLAKPFNII